MASVSVKITENRSGWDKLAKTLAQLERKSVKVGIQANEDAELLTIAGANEFGADIDHPGGTPYIITATGVRFVSKTAPIVHGITKPHKIIIPARPFIRQTFEKRFEELKKIGFQFGGLIIDEKMTLDQALELWGDKFVSFIRSEIAEGDNFEANAPATIRKKGADKHPLQDSGRLQLALKAVVGEK